MKASCRGCIASCRGCIYAIDLCRESLFSFSIATVTAGGGSVIIAIVVVAVFFARLSYLFYLSYEIAFSSVAKSFNNDKYREKMKKDEKCCEPNSTYQQLNN